MSNKRFLLFFLLFRSPFCDFFLCFQIKYPDKMLYIPLQSVYQKFSSLFFSSIMILIQEKHRVHFQKEKKKNLLLSLLVFVFIYRLRDFCTNFPRVISYRKSQSKCLHGWASTDSTGSRDLTVENPQQYGSL